MRLRTPSRRSLLEENRTLRVRNENLQSTVNELVAQAVHVDTLSSIGDRLARQLRHSTSPRTQSIVAEWKAARGA